MMNARGHNLKNLTADIPLGLFTCVTGVSGGGKSTLLVDTLYKAIARKLNNASEAPALHDRIEGLEHIDKIIDIDIDQSPIGRTPRSNPATIATEWGVRRVPIHHLTPLDAPFMWVNS
jgi:excinuclease ABC subunit A